MMNAQKIMDFPLKQHDSVMGVEWTENQKMALFSIQTSGVVQHFLHKLLFRFYI